MFLLKFHLRDIILCSHDGSSVRLTSVELVRDCNVDEEVEDPKVRLLLLLLLLLYLLWLSVSSALVHATSSANKTGIRHMTSRLWSWWVKV